MKIMIDMLHPAHVHFFRNFISEMQKNGHKILVTARKKDVTIELLNAYKIKYTIISEMKRGLFGLFTEWVIRNIKFYRIAKKFKPDVLMGIMGATISPMGKILGIPSVVFWDTESTKKINKIVFWMATYVCTPSCFKGEIGAKQIKYPGFHELAYIHPNRFKPNPLVLKKMHMKIGNKFTVIRFVSWEAINDRFPRCINNRVKFVKELSKYSKIFITSEGNLPKELEEYKIKVSPAEIHNLLYYATLHVGEGATTASEAALLGTPSIYASSIKLGYLLEEEEYELVYNIAEEEKALKKSIEILKDKNIKKKWAIKRNKLLKDKVDVTKIIIDVANKFNKN